MSTVYYGLTSKGLWIWFKSKKPVRNCVQASIICNEPIVKFEVAPLFYQIFRFLYLEKEFKRG